MAKADVEMADAAAPAPAAADDDKDKAPPPFDVAQGIAKNVGFVRKAVEGAQPRLLARALGTRRLSEGSATPPTWPARLRAHLPSDSRACCGTAALSALGSVDNGDAAMTDADEVPDDAPVEVEVYLAFLVVAFLVREKRYEDATKLCEASLPRLRTMMRERRAVDALAAKFYFLSGPMSREARHVCQCRGDAVCRPSDRGLAARRRVCGHFTQRFTEGLTGGQPGRGGAETRLEDGLSRVGVEPPVLPLLVLYGSHPGLAARLHGRPYQIDAVAAQSAGNNSCGL